MRLFYLSQILTVYNQSALLHFHMYKLSLVSDTFIFSYSSPLASFSRNSIWPNVIITTHWKQIFSNMCFIYSRHDFFLWITFLHIEKWKAKSLTHNLEMPCGHPGHFCVDLCLLGLPGSKISKEFARYGFPRVQMNLQKGRQARLYSIIDKYQVMRLTDMYFYRYNISSPKTFRHEFFKGRRPENT